MRPDERARPLGRSVRRPSGSPRPEAPNCRADPSGTRPRDLIATTRTTACTDLLTGLHLARRAILVPAPVVAEVGYLLARAGGAKIGVAFLRSVVAQTVTVVNSNSLYRRMAGLVETCADFPLGTTDTAVTAVAERLGITEIATSGGWAARCCGSGMPGPARR